MGNYLHFGGPDYYPSGGFDDLREAFSAQSDAEAIKRATKTHAEYHDDWFVVISIEGLVWHEVSQHEH